MNKDEFAQLGEDEKWEAYFELRKLFAIQSGEICRLKETLANVIRDLERAKQHTLPFGKPGCCT